MQAKCGEHKDNMAEIISVLAHKSFPTGAFNGNTQSSKWALALAALPAAAAAAAAAAGLHPPQTGRRRADF